MLSKYIFRLKQTIYDLDEPVDISTIIAETESKANEILRKTYLLTPQDYELVSSEQFEYPVKTPKFVYNFKTFGVI